MRSLTPGKAFIGIYGRFSLLALAALVISIVIIFKSGSRKIFTRDHICLVSTILILTAGYLPIHIEERYIWVAQILLLVLAAKIVDDFGWLKQNPKIKSAVLFFAIFSFTLMPIYKLVSRVDTGREDRRNVFTVGKLASTGKSLPMPNGQSRFIWRFSFGDSITVFPISNLAGKICVRNCLIATLTIILFGRPLVPRLNF